MRQGLGVLQAIGTRAYTSSYLAALAQAHGKAG